MARAKLRRTPENPELDFALFNTGLDCDALMKQLVGEMTPEKRSSSAEPALPGSWSALPDGVSFF